MGKIEKLLTAIDIFGMFFLFIAGFGLMLAGALFGSMPGTISANLAVGIALAGLGFVFFFEARRITTGFLKKHGLKKQA